MVTHRNSFSRRIAAILRHAAGALSLGCLLVAGLSLPARASATCLPVIDGLDYCSDARVSAHFITQAYLPDILRQYEMSTDPLVTSRVVTIPLDAPLTSGDEAYALVIDEMTKGTPRFVKLVDLTYQTSKPGSPAAVRMSFIGMIVNNKRVGAVLIDAYSYPDTLVMIYTSREFADGKAILDKQLRLLHGKSVASLKENDA